MHLKRNIMPNFIQWTPLLFQPLQCPAWQHNSPHNLCLWWGEWIQAVTPAAAPISGYLLKRWDAGGSPMGTWEYGSASHDGAHIPPPSAGTPALSSWPFASTPQVVVSNFPTVPGTPSSQSLCLLPPIRVSAVSLSPQTVGFLCDSPCYSLLYFCQFPYSPHTRSYCTFLSLLGAALCTFPSLC